MRFSHERKQAAVMSPCASTLGSHGDGDVPRSAAGGLQIQRSTV